MTPTEMQREAAFRQGWLRDGEELLAPRLAFPLGGGAQDIVHEFNRPARDRVIAEMLDGAARPQSNPSFLGPEPEQAIGEVDRYGIPFRTVVGLTSGLVRADPYYSEEYLLHFFREHFRELYRPKRFSLSWFFSEQVRRGQPVLERVVERLPQRARVLDIGCGMGGMLVPFVLEGHQAIGCDYGTQYVELGRRLGLDLRIGGTEAVRSEAPFDLVLLAHVLQHVRDPLALAAEARSLLKPKGLCFIEVPGLLNLRQYYGGDLLQYFQNANRWHFTADTMRATLRRAGLEAVEINETVTCLAIAAPPDPNAGATGGELVVEELKNLERERAAMAHG